ncbi:hypothetical protein ACOMHN_044801 [Nucella lapillus]
MEMVQSMFGQKTWTAVLEKSDVDEVEGFLQYRYYPDSDTMNLVECVARTVNIPVERVLNNLGHYFVHYNLTHGYNDLLNIVGVDFFSFVQNLDSLHSLVAHCFQGIQCPSFSCYEEEQGIVTVVYNSHRNCLVPMVLGALEEVAKTLFRQEALIEVTFQTTLEIGPPGVVYTNMLKVELRDLPPGKRHVNWALGDLEGLQMERRQADWLVTGSPVDQIGSESIVRAGDFSVAFPYHLVMDSYMCVQQWGENIPRLCSVRLQQGTPFDDVAVIHHPLIHPNLATIRMFSNTVFHITLFCDGNQTPVTLRGQMIWLSHSNHLLFVGSLWMKSLRDLESHRLYMADIPLYDATRHLLFLGQHRYVEDEMQKTHDESRMRLKKLSRQMAEEKFRSEELLNAMLPVKVVIQLKEGKVVRGERFEMCTVLFSDVVEFTVISSRCTAQDVVHMLNDMYNRFDMHNDIHDVFKVKTIGDAYMAVTGVPEVQGDHAPRMADFAMDMLEEVSRVISPATDQPIQIRIGIHSGPILAGVIGRKKPRYDIYGVTVDTSSRMESYGAPGRIHISDVTFRLLYPLRYKFLARGHVTIKGKGDITTYFLVGGRNQTVTQPADKYQGLPIVCKPLRASRRKEELARGGPVMDLQPGNPMLRKVSAKVLRSNRSALINMLHIPRQGVFTSTDNNKGKRLPTMKSISRMTMRSSEPSLTKTAEDLSESESTLTPRTSSEDLVDMAITVPNFTVETPQLDAASILGLQFEDVEPHTGLSDEDNMFSSYFDKHIEEEEEARKQQTESSILSSICSCVLS